jgi:hypothetical protein
MKEQSMTCRCLSKDGETVHAMVNIEGIPPEVAVVVAFGPTPAGKKTSCRVVGSSSEKTGRKKKGGMGAELWDDDNKQDTEGSGQQDAVTAMALSMTQ